MAETLSNSDRELNFLQFGDKTHSSKSTDGINLIGLSSEIAQNSNLEFSINFSDSDTIFPRDYFENADLHAHTVF